MKPIVVSPVKGTRDFYPEGLRLRAWLFEHWRAVASQFGYEEYDSCMLEHESLYIRKAGDEITSQLYNFADKGDRRVALRPEITPSLARMYIARAGQLSLPARWFSIPQCFRYERMQRGRTREHYQWNMDIIGLEHVAAEVELMAAQAAFLRRVGLRLAGDSPQIVFRVSNRQVLQEVLAGFGIQGEAFLRVCVVIDKRDKVGREGTGQLLREQGLTPDVATQVLDLLELRGIDEIRQVAGRDSRGVQQLQTVLELARSSGIADAVRVNVAVVRGLSYYTGTVWEVYDQTGAVPRAIAGGGRYDRLVETFGGKPTPMVGFGFGDVVILEILKHNRLLPELSRSVADVVYPMNERGFVAANELATRLRRAGRQVLVDYSCRRFKHVVRAAEALHAERLLILGDGELERGVCRVRKLSAGREEHEIALGALE